VASTKIKIKKIAELIEKTSLIVWDEALVNHRFCFEALDHTLKRCNERSKS
jgi:hypothetical protein